MNVVTCFGFMYCLHQDEAKIRKGICAIILKSGKKGTEMSTLHWAVNAQPARGLAQCRAWYRYIIRVAWVSSHVRTVMTDTESISETSVGLKILTLISTRKIY